MHRERLASVASSIDTRAPRSQPHLTLYGRDYAAKKKATTEAAFHDLKMIQAIAKTMTRKHEIPERKGPTSLNADARKQQMYRIMHENHRMLSAIEGAEAFAHTKDLLREHRDKKKYIINASHTMRLAGQYDDDIIQFQREEQVQKEKRSPAHRMRHTAGSVSLPSLTPTIRAEDDFPPPPVGTLNRSGNSTSSKTGASGSKAGWLAASVSRKSSDHAAVVARSQVNFSDPTENYDPDHDSEMAQRKQRKHTPHPNKLNNSAKQALGEFKQEISFQTPQDSNQSGTEDNDEGLRRQRKNTPHPNKLNDSAKAALSELEEDQSFQAPQDSNQSGTEDSADGFCIGNTVMAENVQKDNGAVLPTAGTSTNEMCAEVEFPPTQEQEVEFPLAEPVVLKAEDLEEKNPMRVKNPQANASSSHDFEGKKLADRFGQSQSDQPLEQEKGEANSFENFEEPEYDDDFVEESKTLNMTSTMTKQSTTEESGTYDGND